MYQVQAIKRYWKTSHVMPQVNPLSLKIKKTKKQDYVCNLQTVQTGCESMNDKSLIS